MYIDRCTCNIASTSMLIIQNKKLFSSCFDCSLSIELTCIMMCLLLKSMTWNLYKSCGDLYNNYIHFCLGKIIWFSFFLYKNKFLSIMKNKCSRWMCKLNCKFFIRLFFVYRKIKNDKGNNVFFNKLRKWSFRMQDYIRRHN